MTVRRRRGRRRAQPRLPLRRRPLRRRPVGAGPRRRAARPSTTTTATTGRSTPRCAPTTTRYEIDGDRVVEHPAAQPPPDADRRAADDAHRRGHDDVDVRRRRPAPASPSTSTRSSTTSRSAPPTGSDDTARTVSGRFLHTESSATSSGSSNRAPASAYSSTSTSPSPSSTPEYCRRVSSNGVSSGSAATSMISSASARILLLRQLLEDLVVRADLFLVVVELVGHPRSSHVADGRRRSTREGDIEDTPEGALDGIRVLGGRAAGAGPAGGGAARPARRRRDEGRAAGLRRPVALAADLDDRPPQRLLHGLQPGQAQRHDRRAHARPAATCSCASPSRPTS